MKLYIAEKPSLGRAIAEALPKPQKKHQGYIEIAGGDVVTWCVGHILEQADPDSYDEKFKKWQLEHLPIIPNQWQLKPKYKTKSQLAIIRKFVKQCSQIIHAGDPDREGQLLVDEVIDYLNVTSQKRDSMQRLLISDLNLPAVKRSLNQLQPNKHFIPLSVSALARSRADWLYGINLTRAYTIQGGKVGYQGVLSVGRVQTPILGLVVNRDKEINNFTSKPFYEVLAHIFTPSQQQFTAKWQPSEACQAYMDDEGRVLSKGLAENVVGRISNQPATIDDIKSLIADFAKAAENAIEAGFDGVEIHGANGYLIDQFLHYAANERTDEYGQTPENMARFAIEVTDAVINAVGNERTAIRLSPGAYFNMEEDKRDKAVFDYLLAQLDDKKLAYIHGGIFDDSTQFDSLEGKTTSQYLRANTKTSLVGVGSYSFDDAKQAINNDQFDLIAIGRPFIANPDYISKVANNEELVAYSDEMLAKLF